MNGELQKIVTSLILVLAILVLVPISPVSTTIHALSTIYRTSFTTISYTTFTNTQSGFPFWIKVYDQTWSASVTVIPSEVHIVQGQKATFTVTVSLLSYAHVDIHTLVLWLKLMQISGGSQFSIVSKDFGSGPISGNPPYQATLTLQSSSTTPLGLRLFHIVSADSLRDLSTCPTQVGNAMFCGDSGTFGVYVDAP